MVLALLACDLIAQDARHLFSSPPVSTTNTANVLIGVLAKVPPDQGHHRTNEVTNSIDGLDNTHKLAIGDQVSFRIIEDEDDPKLLFVADSGEIEVPYIGRRPAAGKTCRQLAFAIKTDLEKEYYYRATVIIAVNVMAKSRGKVYVVGPVRVPGPQEIPSDEVFTLSKAILQAGGFNDFANRHHVKVTRPAKLPGGADQVYEVNVADILENGRTESDLVLEPGDLIYVPERLIRF